MNTEEILSNWYNGWLFWSSFYYATGFLSILLPAMLAAGFPEKDKPKRLVSALIAVLFSTIAWLQPGYRATKKADGLACLRNLIATNNVSAPEKFKECLDAYNYKYVEIEVDTIKGLAGKPIP
jgi:hypothetical protein